ncbi:hypothetical protein C100_16620 [Sphingobium sp. C100]|nr:hypothetical protein C100_16620 [Sphingobium sp. C100]
MGARPRAHGDISEPIGLLGELLEGGSMTRISDIDGLRTGGAVSRGALFLAVSFAVLLAGCSDKGEREISNDAANVAPPPAMPPSIVASHTYRCADGGLLYVDFLQDGTSINVRRQPSGPVLRLSTPSQGLAYVGDGMNLTVSGKEVRIDEPKKASRTCKRG